MRRQTGRDRTWLNGLDRLWWQPVSRLIMGLVMAFKWFSLQDGKKTFEFRCADCGELHEGSPSFGYKKPPHYFLIPEEEPDDRIHLNSDLCVIDDEEFYIRTILNIPVHDVEAPFTWGVWVSQRQEGFLCYQETHGDD